MRLQSFLSLLLAAGPLSALAQSATDSLRRRPTGPLLTTVPVSGLRNFAVERSRLDQRGLAVLGTWAVANLAIGSVASGQTEGAARHFHQMNAGWGAVNLALAGAGYLAARRAARAPSPTQAENVRAQLRTENLYLFNAGLDVAYLATGVYLLEKGQDLRT